MYMGISLNQKNMAVIKVWRDHINEVTVRWGSTVIVKFVENTFIYIIFVL